MRDDQCNVTLLKERLVELYPSLKDKFALHIRGANKEGNCVYVNLFDGRISHIFYIILWRDDIGLYFEIDSHMLKLNRHHYRSIGSTIRRVKEIMNKLAQQFRFLFTAN